MSLLCRLAASVPPPGFHVVRHAGVLAPAHKWRSFVVPPRPADDQNETARAHAHTHTPKEPERPATHRCRLVDHYDAHLSLALTTEEKASLVEYLKSL